MRQSILRKREKLSEREQHTEEEMETQKEESKSKGKGKGNFPNSTCSTSRIATLGSALNVTGRITLLDEHSRLVGSAEFSYNRAQQRWNLRTSLVVFDLGVIPPWLSYSIISHASPGGRSEQPYTFHFRQSSAKLSQSTAGAQRHVKSELHMDENPPVRTLHPNWSSF